MMISMQRAISRRFRIMMDINRSFWEDPWNLSRSRLKAKFAFQEKNYFVGFFIDRSLVDDDQYTYVKEHCQVVQIEKKSKHRLGIIDYDEDDIKFILLFLLNLNFLKNILNEKLFAKL